MGDGEKVPQREKDTDRHIEQLTIDLVLSGLAAIGGG